MRILFLETQDVPASGRPAQHYEAGEIYDLPPDSARFWKFKDVAIDAAPAEMRAVASIDAAALAPRAELADAPPPAPAGFVTAFAFTTPRRRRAKPDEAA